MGVDFFPIVFSFANMTSQNNALLSLVRLLKRNLAEHRMKQDGNQIDIVFTRAIKENLDRTVEQMEMNLIEMNTPVQEEEVATVQLPEVAVEEPKPEPTPLPQEHTGMGVAKRSAANLKRDSEIREIMKKQHQANAEKQTSAIGPNRDTVTRTMEIMSPFATPPESELRENNMYLPEIPGTNTRPPSPMERLTEYEFSELLRYFTPSAAVPEGRGVISVPSKHFPWHRDINVEEREPARVVTLPQGAYGVNPESGAPKHIVFRLPKALVLWNMGFGMDSVRIFYVGRSNITGYWLTAQHLTMQEQMSVIAGLVELRRRLSADAEGKEYVSIARVRD